MDTAPVGTVQDAPPAHVHTWREIGRCKHPHSSGSNDYALFVCAGDCGRFGHRGPITFACMRGRRSGPTPPADCPVGQEWTDGEREVLIDRYQAEAYELVKRTEEVIAASRARKEAAR